LQDDSKASLVSKAAKQKETKKMNLGKRIEALVNISGLVFEASEAIRNIDNQVLVKVTTEKQRRMLELSEMMLEEVSEELNRHIELLENCMEPEDLDHTEEEEEED